MFTLAVNINFHKHPPTTDHILNQSQLEFFREVEPTAHTIFRRQFPAAQQVNCRGEGYFRALLTNGTFPIFAAYRENPLLYKPSPVKLKILHAFESIYKSTKTFMVISDSPECLLI